MARNFIKVETGVTTATKARDLVNFVLNLRTAFELGTRVREIMDHNNDGTNFADLEALFGLPTGQGQTVYNMVINCIGSLNGTVTSNDGKQLTERVG
jgi:DNA gyrase/topoisomerase IV subunit A